MVGYIGIVHKEHTSDYGVSFPDFPGCVTAGKTPEEAYEMALEALQFHMEGMIEEGETIPVPSAYERLAKAGAFKGTIFSFMVPARVPGKSIRINVNMDENLVREIDGVAKNRSAFLAKAAQEKLSHREAT